MHSPVEQKEKGESFLIDGMFTKSLSLVFACELFVSGCKVAGGDAAEKGNFVLCLLTKTS